jgi:hypothetical protein
VPYPRCTVSTKRFPDSVRSTQPDTKALGHDLSVFGSCCTSRFVFVDYLKKQSVRSINFSNDEKGCLRAITIYLSSKLKTFLLNIRPTAIIIFYYTFVESFDSAFRNCLCLLGYTTNINISIGLLFLFVFNL